MGLQAQLCGTLKYILKEFRNITKPCDISIHVVRNGKTHMTEESRIAISPDLSES